MTVPALAVTPVDGYPMTALEPVPANPTGGRLVAWAEAAQSAGQLGAALAKTSFVPAQFRGKPEECAAAILFGDELGMSPMQALQAIYVVSGRVGMYAEAMVAIVQAAGHEVVTVAKSDSKVTVRGRRRGSETWIEETWTTERARRAGYTTNKKYETDPQAMLYARAASVVCRQIAADALAGIAYSIEELELSEPGPTARVTRNAASSSTTVQRQPVAVRQDAETEKEPQAVDVEPSFEDPVDTATGEIVEADVVDNPEPKPAAPETISPAQTRMMGALMKELGITRREDALTYCVDVIRREITSRDQLTKNEASLVIDALNADKVAHDAAAGLPTEPTFDEDGAA